MKRLRALRKKSPILLADFFNDGPTVGGCIAVDRYLRINCRGDVEPCVFIHFSADNVRKKSLADILDFKFFQAIRRRQPDGESITRHMQEINSRQIFEQVHPR